jgi:hypothetical protein
MLGVSGKGRLGGHMVRELSVGRDAQTLWFERGIPIHAADVARGPVMCEVSVNHTVDDLARSALRVRPAAPHREVRLLRISRRRFVSPR